MQGTPGQGNFCNQREHVIACTIVTVMCTVFGLGGFTKPVLGLCGIEMGVSGHADAGHGSGETPRLASAFSHANMRRQKSQLNKQGLKQAIVSFNRNVLLPVLVADEEELPQTSHPTGAHPPSPPAEAEPDEATPQEERL